MKWIRCKQIVGVSVKVMAIALVVACAHSAPNSPPGPSVTVVNYLTNPVPVSVVNFPSGTNTVLVSSSANAPVFVREVPKETFSTNGTVSLTNGAFLGGVEILTPPAGKRAVIETITVSAFAPPGQTALADIISDSTTYVLALTPQGTFLGRDFFRGTFPIRLYSRAHVVAQFLRDPATGGADAFFSISGYFEDAP